MQELGLEGSVFETLSDMYARTLIGSQIYIGNPQNIVGISQEDKDHYSPFRLGLLCCVQLSRAPFFMRMS